MIAYRIYRLRDSLRNRFRWAPHTSGVTNVKPMDYSEEGSVDAPTPYAAWHELKSSELALVVGDLLEHPDGDLFIYKYVGFEEARWVLPEVKTGLESVPPAIGEPQPAIG